MVLGLVFGALGFAKETQSRCQKFKIDAKSGVCGGRSPQEEQPEACQKQANKLHLFSQNLPTCTTEPFSWRPRPSKMEANSLHNHSHSSSKRCWKTTSSSELLHDLERPGGQQQWKTNGFLHNFDFLWTAPFSTKRRPKSARDALAGALAARARRGMWLVGRIKEVYDSKIPAWTSEFKSFVSEDMWQEAEAALEART